MTELPSCHFRQSPKSLREFWSCKTDDLNLDIFIKLGSEHDTLRLRSCGMFLGCETSNLEFVLCVRSQTCSSQF